MGLCAKYIFSLRFEVWFSFPPIIVSHFGNMSAYLHLLGDEPVQPARVDGVVLKAFSLQQLNEVLHCRPEVSSDRQLLQSHHHVPRERERHNDISQR